MSENRYQLRDFVLPGDDRSDEELADLQVSVRLADYVTFVNALPSDCYQLVAENNAMAARWLRHEEAPEDDKAALAVVVALVDSTGPRRGQAYVIEDNAVPLYRTHERLMDRVRDLFPGV